MDPGTQPSSTLLASSSILVTAYPSRDLGVAMQYSLMHLKLEVAYEVVVWMVKRSVVDSSRGSEGGNAGCTKGEARLEFGEEAYC